MRTLSIKIHGKVKCESQTTVMSVWWAPTGALALWPVAVWVRFKLIHWRASKAGKMY